MNSVFFSPGSKSFYLQELFPEYEDAGTLPDDVIEITRETYEQFLGLHPEGKEIGADSSGRPVWINCKRLVRTVLIFTESSDQLSRATDRVPGLPASPGYVQ